jgi:hypothetical protein
MATRTGGIVVLKMLTMRTHRQPAATRWDVAHGLCMLLEVPLLGFAPTAAVAAIAALELPYLHLTAPHQARTSSWASLIPCSDRRA